MAAYQAKPCRRCAGDKGPKGQSRNQWYCGPCAAEAQKDYWRKNLPWWCAACDMPWYCVTCARNKRDRMKAAMAGRKTRSQSSYFRPINAERWWQQRSHALVQVAIKRGFLPNLKTSEYACMDCGAVAVEYDHRDYGRPFDVNPVCRSCNKQRGTAIWPTAERFLFERFRHEAPPQTEAA